MAANSPSRFERFLTLADVADILNVELAVVRDLVQSNELAAIRIGEVGEWRVEQQALEDYVQDRYEAQRREAKLAQSDFDDFPELDARASLASSDDLSSRFWR